MKNLPAMWEIWVYSLCPDRPWRRARQPIPVFLLVEFHGQRRLADYIVCGVAEWDPAEGPALTLTCVSPLASAYSAGDPGSIPGSEDPLEEGTATHSSILAWRTPWTEEAGGLQSMGSQRFGHD